MHWDETKTGPALVRTDLTGEKLSFEPRNEAGVILLFGQYAPELGFQILDAQTDYPDCRARYRSRTVRIEFEYRSRNFQHHWK